ncbi:MAG: hypothetical protein OEZ33_08755 [Gammaproteobacteria bacterium]|nr:hypothetical protein [Gammaproteobacteria bacterium]MDH5778287.1 hypothetical protein [Gammaproteobacteria bacterium]
MLKNIIQICFLLCLFAIGACSSDDAAELTLDNCTTTIGDGVPEFYRKYFKCSTITISGANIIIESDGLPPHRTAYYGSGHPNYTDFDTSGGRNQNPNTISSQTIHLEFPLNPTSRGLTIDGSLVDATQGNNSNEYTMGTAGVALDGVSLYNALAAPGHNIDDEYFTFDSYDAHADANGGYHYHSATSGPLEVLESIGLITNTTPASAQIEFYGIMCDGTLVLGCTELNGSAISSGDFDSQNGHVHDVLDAAGVGLASRYHVHVCPGTYTTHKYNPEIQYYNACTSN